MIERPPEALLADARALADEVLFPRALEVDHSSEVPIEQLARLAEAGLYGVSTYCDPPTVAQLIEILASGCLTTTFVWAQHLGATAAAWNSELPVRAELGEPLAAGRLRAGVAFAHLLRPGPPLTTAMPVDGGWQFRGTAPWVTGWGHIDVVHAGARHGEDIVWALIDAVDGETLVGDRLDLAVAHASATVTLAFRDHVVPGSRVTRIENHEDWKARYQLGLRNNGSLPLGVASRCCRLLGESTFDARLVEARQSLDEASVDDMAEARAKAALLAVRVATALVAQTGGRAVIETEHAQRLFRESMFLLVQGQTPAIKAEMLADLARQSALRP